MAVRGGIVRAQHAGELVDEVRQFRGRGRRAEHVVIGAHDGADVAAEAKCGR